MRCVLIIIIMTIPEIIVTILLASGALFLTVLLPQLWTGRGKMVARMESNMKKAFGAGFSEKFLRSLPIVPFVLCAMIFMLAFGEKMGDALMVLLSSVFFFLFGLDLSVTYFNRPRILVPPRFRREQDEENTNNAT